MRPLARRRGFTLIEVMAAVTIFALLVGLVAPRIATLTARSLRQRAEEIAGRIELARQRAVVTGVRHRLVLDLDRGGYWIEWEGDDEPTPAPAPAPAFDPGARRALPEAPPPEEAHEYRPLPGKLGDFRALGETLRFAGVQTPGGWAARGEAWVEFERDGSASYTEIHLDDDSGRGLVLEVPALDDAVRIGDVAV